MMPGIWSAPQLSIPLPLSLPFFLFLFEHQNHLSPIRGCLRPAFRQVAQSILEKRCSPAGAWCEGSGWVQTGFRLEAALGLSGCTTLLNAGIVLGCES